MHENDEVCLCHHVTLRKIRTYMQREDPPVASLISECLGAGTGCGWCVPYLRQLHEQHKAGADLTISIEPDSYASSHQSFASTGERPEDPIKPD